MSLTRLIAFQTGGNRSGDELLGGRDASCARLEAMWLGPLGAGGQGAGERQRGFQETRVTAWGGE
jgi:hypothetical protein